MTEYREKTDWQEEYSNSQDHWEQEEQPEEKGKRYQGTQLLLVVQIALCGVILLGTLGVKLIGGELYEGFRTWYLTEVNKSIIASDDIELYQETWNSIFSPQKNNDANSEATTSSELGAALAVSFPSTVNNSSGKPVQLSVALTAPLQAGTVSSAFGERKDPITGKEKVHKGIDIAAQEGAPIGAALQGQVKEATENDSYGKYILLDHGNGIQTRYAHCSEILVKEGDQIARGQQIAKVGKTGQATGSHLHLELLINGESYDPGALLKGTDV